MMLYYVLATFVAAACASSNMNGDYVVASGGKFDVPFNSDYGSKGHEYFDVWAPEIASHYGDVFWTSQGNHPIPDHIIKRFDGKVIAITGYEQDQVIVSPVGQPGVNPEKDVSVPINWAYNHHYMAWMSGKHAEMVQIKADPNDVSAHGAPAKLVARDLPSAAERTGYLANMPTNQMFSEGNGGESRHSFHGYPNNYAQLIESPRQWTITPMQIDTRNRDCGIRPEDVSNCTPANHGFIPGPEPRQARYGRGVPAAGTNYSGILECPCNSKFGGDPLIYGKDSLTKQVTHDFTAVAQGTCSASEHVDGASSCFAAIASLGFASHVSNESVSNASLPQGCSVVTDGAGNAQAYFNTGGAASCAQGKLRSGTASVAIGVSMSITLNQTGSAVMSRASKGLYCADNHVDVLKKFLPKDPSAPLAQQALADCEAYCESDERCNFCSVDEVDRRNGLCQWVAIPTCGAQLKWSGKLPGDISSKVSSGVATITATGPADKWFGIGLDAQVMADQPYTFIINGSGVIEQHLGTCGSEAEHCPGTPLAPSIKMVSMTVVAGKRTAVFTRDFVGITKNHFTFSMGKPTIPFISAIGKSQVWGVLPHLAHMAGVVSLSAPGEATCVCDLGAAGKLCENDGSRCNSFVKNCVPTWHGAGEGGDLLGQENPTCNSRQYSGGLRCCINGHNLLDHDQVIPEPVLRYHMKFRFWFQEYTPPTASKNASHANLDRVYYQTEAHAGEYDIPPAFALPNLPVIGYENWPVNKPTPGTTCTGTCPDGPDCECIHTITYHFTMGPTRLLYAGGHCHAPACISIELYHNLTGTPVLLCRQLPVYGAGNVAKDKWDEAGYLALPPCLWGDDEGLEPSVLLPRGTPMFSVKKNRNTHMGHFGEMASWQMRGTPF